MNLKKFLRFFVMQSLILFTNFRYVEAFSLRENSEPIITTPLEAIERYITAPFLSFAGAKGHFATQNLEITLEGLVSKIEALLSPLAFSLLFFLMLAYWSQAAFFGQEKYKTLNNFIFFLAMASLTLLLVIRWIVSRHFPLSNLYESLVFLSLCFLSLKAFFLPRRKPLQKANAKHLSPTLQNKILNSLERSETKRSVVNKTCTNLQFVSNSELPYVPYKASQTSTNQGFKEPDFCESRASSLTKSNNFRPGESHFRRALRLQSRALFAKLPANQKFVRNFVRNPEVDGLNPQTGRNLVRNTLGERNVRPEHNFDPVPAVEKKVDLLGLGLGVILSPLSLLTFGFAFLSLPKEMQQSTALVPALQSNWLMMHVTVMILSYAALISGSILAIAFLILSYFENSYILDDPLFFDKDNAKQNIIPGEKMLATKVEYSSLTVRLDNYSYRILALGFPLLTIGILSGAVWANEAWGSYWSWDPKETWALITWLVFAIYLHTRITKGWSGKKPAIVASTGFFMVWFCYLGVNLLGTGLHSYGWFTG